MDKQAFIHEIVGPLKELGYRKNRNYWYKPCNNIIFCINVQGSQWDKSDYYVEIGVAVSSENTRTPSLLQWYCRHRCKGVNGEKNIQISEFLATLSKVFDGISFSKDVEIMLEKYHAIKVGYQYWF